MTSIMNTNYKIKETHVSNISSFEDRNIKPGLKTSALRNNNTMTNDYRTCTSDPPVPHNRSDTPRMRSSTCSLRNKPGLKTSALMKNKTMNHIIRTILDEPVPHIGIATLRPTPFRRIIRSLRDTARKAANTAKRKWNEYYDWLSTYVPPPIRVLPNSLKGSALRNNSRSTILDEPVPHIGVETLRPTPFRRRIQSLKDSTRKVVNKVKKKWNDFNDWIIDYVPPAIRVNPSSAIEKL